MEEAPGGLQLLLDCLQTQPHTSIVSASFHPKPLETLPAWRDSKPISANSAETQLGLQIVVRADRDTLPIRLWIHLPAGEVCCGSHCNTQ